jgi:trk system potassium uptake protein TrkH
LHRIHLNPWQYLILSFSLLILFGTILLQLPIITHTNGITTIDACFTATSAICVTGLTTVSTSGFNLGGQLGLLLLMQLGAIGIMTLTSSFLIAFRGKLSLVQKVSFSKLQENFEIKDANSILKNIITITFITEFIGFVLLSIGFLIEGLSFSNALYQGFFHSISAFCNAGFSTYDTSIVNLNPLIKYTISFLIIVGGLGYFVIYELIEKYKHQKKLSFHSKIVLSMTVALIIGGTILLFIFEKGTMNITDSFFQSVTTRTAGFNSVDLSKLNYASIFLILLLMFIGASPGSTGGGIKTTTFFIVIYSIFNVLKGKTEVVVFNRTISIKYILKAFAISFIYFGIIVIGVTLLLQESNFSLQEALFEAISAMGTVGLTLGITPNLDTFGKGIVIALMFIGRIGPASLALATMTREKQIKIKYPEGNIY